MSSNHEEPSAGSGTDRDPARARGVAWIVAFVVVAILGGAIGVWWTQREPFPDTTMVWRPSRAVTVKDVVIERDDRERIHLYLDGLLDRESHREEPLQWQHLRGRSDLSVALKGKRGTPDGEFAFWFGSLSDGDTGETRWFQGDGAELSSDDLVAVAANHEIDLDRWQRSLDSRAKAGSRMLRLVGGFQGVTGFIAGGFLYDAEDPSVRMEGSGMGNSHTPPPQYVTVTIPKLRSSLPEKVGLAVDLAWGDEMAAFTPPEVGASVAMSDFDAQIIFKEKGAQNAESDRGDFSSSFSLGKRNVPCTTLGFFLSDPGLIGLIYPKVIVQRSGREEVRYFLPGRDVPTVSVPVRIEYIERVELHYRDHRRRVTFPLGRLPLDPEA